MGGKRFVAMRIFRVGRVLCALSACIAVCSATARAQPGSAPSGSIPPLPTFPSVQASPTVSGEGSPAGEAILTQFLASNVTPIDLPSAFRLAGEENPQVLIAHERVIESLALRQLAAAQFLPTLNAGTSLNSHRGVLQPSAGNILQVNRDSLYAGAGAFAVGGGTVNIPGVVLTGNVAVWIYDYLVAAQ